MAIVIFPEAIVAVPKFPPKITMWVECWVWRDTRQSWSLLWNSVRRRVGYEGDGAHWLFVGHSKVSNKGIYQNWW